MATYRTILTKKGKELIAAAGASGIPIVLTDMAVGDGNGNPVTPVETQTSLARERYRHAVNQLTVDVNDASRFTAELLIPASVGGFTMREVGLYTNDGFLFAVANVPAAYKPTDTEGSFGDTAIRMVFTVSNASVVTLVADPNVAVATHTWVLNNVNAASLLPGGLTNQILAKKSNADGDVIWKDPTEGVTVIVWSREETQTLAASQTVIDLAQLTAEGVAVYIEGVRLRKNEFSETGPTQITLAASRPAGTRVTIVQNEEVGATDVLQRPNNLSDVPDKAAARTNLGLPNWLASSTINWSQLVNVPAYASRWADWMEITGKPTSFPPSAHQHAWGDITSGIPDTASRWPTWNEVTSKPSLFPPAAHSHSEYVQKAGDRMTGLLGVYMGAVNTQQVVQDYGYSDGNRRWAVVLENAAYTLYSYNATGGAPAKRFVIDNSNGDAFFYGSMNFYRNVPSIRFRSPGGNNGYDIFANISDAVSDGVHIVNAVNGTQLCILREASANFSGSVNAAGGFDFGSSRKLKDIDGPVPYGLEAVERMELAAGHYKPEYNDDGRRRLFFVAEQLAELVPEAVDLEGVEFNGERVPSIKLDQLLPVMAKAIQELAAEVRALKEGR